MPWEDILEIEDYLQENKVFVNGITGRTCHSDSYMTIVEFKALDQALSDSKFSKERWAESVEYWLTNPNMQPPLRLVAFQVCRKFAIPEPETSRCRPTGSC